MNNWRSGGEYRDWREQVIDRDTVCKCCGQKDNLHAHHVKHATFWPELRFDVKNGITLCRDCHTQFHTNFKRSYRQKCDEVDLMNFFELVRYFDKKPIINRDRLPWVI